MSLEEARERQAFNQAELERMKWFLEDMKELSPVKGEWARINEEHTRLSRYNVFCASRHCVQAERTAST